MRPSGGRRRLETDSCRSEELDFEAVRGPVTVRREAALNALCHDGFIILCNLAVWPRTRKREAWSDLGRIGKSPRGSLGQVV